MCEHLYKLWHSVGVMAQMVERRTASMKVPGSNPGSGTTKQIDRFTTWLDSVPNIQSKLIYHAVAIVIRYKVYTNTGKKCCSEYV